MNVVCVIQAGTGAVKITSSAHERVSRLVANLQHGNPDTLTLRAQLAGDDDLRALLHGALSHHRIRDDWFAADALAELDQAIEIIQPLARNPIERIPFDEAGERRRTETADALAELRRLARNGRRAA